MTAGISATPREQRLRARIDEVTDQRDAALAALWKVRSEYTAKTLELRDVRRSRDLWKGRARNAERMQTEKARSRRRYEQSKQHQDAVA